MGLEPAASALVWLRSSTSSATGAAASSASGSATPATGMGEGLGPSHLHVPVGQLGGSAPQLWTHQLSATSAFSRATHVLGSAPLASAEESPAWLSRAEASLIPCEGAGAGGGGGAGEGEARG